MSARLILENLLILRYNTRVKGNIVSNTHLQGDKIMTTLAVIGCGRISASHIPALSKIDGVKVKYACDLIIEKAQKKKEEFPELIENVITDYHVALNDPEVEAVFILTPNYAHYTISMDALKAGKHVFCEKPITVNYPLSVEMAEEAKKQNKILNIGVCNRFNKSIELLQQMNANGEFGDIYHVVCNFRAFRSIPGLGGAFTTKAQSGGGVLIDWGVHYLDLILYILGEPKLKTVSCNAYNVTAKDMSKYKYSYMWAEDTKDIENGTNDVDDFISGYVRTEKASISFNGAWAQNIAHDERFIDFLGDKRGARLTYMGKFEVYDAETLETIKPEYDIPDMYEQEDRAFIDSFKSGVPNRSNIQRVLESAKLLDRLYASAEISKEIEL